MFKKKDCELACPAPIPPPVVVPCDIWGIDCANFGSIVLFILLASTFLTTLLISNVKRRSIRTNERLIGDGNINDYFIIAAHKALFCLILFHIYVCSFIYLFIYVCLIALHFKIKIILNMRFYIFVY